MPYGNMLLKRQTSAARYNATESSKWIL